MPSPYLNQISWKSKFLWLHIHMFDGDLMYNQPSGSIYPLKSSLLCHVVILFWFYLTKQFHLWVEPRFLKAFNPHLFLISQQSYDKQPHFHVHPSWLKWLITMSSFTYVYPFINSIKPNCMCIQSVHIYICVSVCGLLIPTKMHGVSNLHLLLFHSHLSQFSWIVTSCGRDWYTMMARLIIQYLPKTQVSIKLLRIIRSQCSTILPRLLIQFPILLVASVFLLVKSSRWLVQNHNIHLKYPTKSPF